MSHAAIVAREYGMPAVVGTGDATKRIRTGQRVRVDGDRGIVQVIVVTVRTRSASLLFRCGARRTCGAADVGLRVGGKAAALGELARAGMPRPARVRDHRGGVRPRSWRRSTRPARSARAVEALPADDLAAIARAAAGFRAPGRGGAAAARGRGGDHGRVPRSVPATGWDAAVAVRSSATMEDSAGGQLRRAAGHLSGGPRRRRGARPRAPLLGQPVQRRVGRPTGAAWGMAEAGLAMAVVVQRMVSPRAAGVMFTRSPVTGDRSVVAIEGTWGLGSALVAGDVTPDSFTVSKVTGEITGRRVGAKLGLHSFRRTATGSPPSAMPTALRRSPCLTDDEVRALAAVGRAGGRALRRAAGHRVGAARRQPGLPGLDGDAADRIVLLQSRPETVWAARERPPVATPKPRASDHVLARFVRPL